MDVKYDLRETLFGNAYGVIRLFGAFSVKNVSYNTCYCYTIWYNGPQRSIIEKPQSKMLTSFSTITSIYLYIVVINFGITRYFSDKYKL